jgi:aryl-alcohol dehydrogenase-like predicted oxidoreductase
MKARSLPGTALAVPPVILGCADFGVRVSQKSAQAIVGAALDAGITMFDAIRRNRQAWH